MKKFDFLILSLAIWRISNMLVKENGPAYIFEHLRHRVGIRRKKDNPDATYAEDPDSFMATLLLCVWCLSVWIAGAWTALYAINKKIAIWTAMPFALSAVACLVDRWDGWSDR